VWDSDHVKHARGLVHLCPVHEGKEAPATPGCPLSAASGDPAPRNLVDTLDHTG
jgi:hypothetical protein